VEFETREEADLMPTFHTWVLQEDCCMASMPSVLKNQHQAIKQIIKEGGFIAVSIQHRQDGHLQNLSPPCVWTFRFEEHRL
jgi:hypothetical protein